MSQVTGGAEKIPGLLGEVVHEALRNARVTRCQRLVNRLRQPANLTLKLASADLRPLEGQHTEADGHICRRFERLGHLVEIYVSHQTSLLLVTPGALLRCSSSYGAEQAAPAVVAVVVACGHGTWLDEALYSLATQDYPNLSVLVMEVGADEKVADRVGVFVPNAHFARMPPGTTFAQAANKALEMVEGAAHVLVCHDDVALAPDAVRLLLEEAYRSNAGLTCPKFVSWDHPDRLLSVGMGADHLGVVHPLVEPGELDQGQHDAAHEVFVAPSGAVLVRKDLWRALGGFSTAAGAPGEDLDLSWRAHLAGARVVVAPQARARHLEAGAKGLRRDGPAKAARARSGPSKAGVSATAADGGSDKSSYGSDAASSAGPSMGPGLGRTRPMVAPAPV